MQRIAGTVGRVARRDDKKRKVWKLQLKLREEKYRQRIAMPTPHNSITNNINNINHKKAILLMNRKE